MQPGSRVEHGMTTKNMPEIKIGGTYQHYKGNKMKVLGLAKHSETLEDYVYYEHEEEALPNGAPQEASPSKFWVRPASMWFEEVDTPGYKGPRFRFVSD